MEPHKWSAQQLNTLNHLWTIPTAIIYAVKYVLCTVNHWFWLCCVWPFGSPQVGHEMNRDNLIEHKLSSDQMVVRFQWPMLTSSNMPRPPNKKERYIYIHTLILYAIYIWYGLSSHYIPTFWPRVRKVSTHIVKGMMLIVEYLSWV